MIMSTQAWTYSKRKPTYNQLQKKSSAFSKIFKKDKSRSNHVKLQTNERTIDKNSLSEQDLLLSPNIFADNKIKEKGKKIKTKTGKRTNGKKNTKSYKKIEVSPEIVEEVTNSSFDLIIETDCCMERRTNQVKSDEKSEREDEDEESIPIPLKDKGDDWRQPSSCISLVDIDCENEARSMSPKLVSICSRERDASSSRSFKSSPRLVSFLSSMQSNSLLSKSTNSGEASTSYTYSYVSTYTDGTVCGSNGQSSRTTDKSQRSKPHAKVILNSTKASHKESIGAIRFPPELSPIALPDDMINKNAQEISVPVILTKEDVKTDKTEDYNLKRCQNQMTNSGEKKTTEDKDQVNLSTPLQSKKLLKHMSTPTSKPSTASVNWSLSPIKADSSQGSDGLFFKSSREVNTDEIIVASMMEVSNLDTSNPMLQIEENVQLPTAEIDPNRLQNKNPNLSKSVIKTSAARNGKAKKNPLQKLYRRIGKSKTEEKKETMSTVPKDPFSSLCAKAMDHVRRGYGPLTPKCYENCIH